MKILGNQNKIELIKKLITKNQFPNSLILIGQKAIGKSLIAKNIALCLTKSINLLFHLKIEWMFRKSFIIFYDLRLRQLIGK